MLVPLTLCNQKDAGGANSIFRSSALPANSVVSHGAGRGSSGSRGMYLLVVCHPAAKIFLGVVSFL